MTEMPDREKILAGLAACLPETEEDAEIGCPDCPYGCGQMEVVSVPVTMLEDALALLKVQEPRLLTLAEALAADYVYLEIKLHASLPCGCCILAVDPDGGILPLHKGFCAYLDGEDYGIDWRCWTSRPTEEQREATPWQVT